jgi:hypothetical protein
MEWFDESGLMNILGRIEVPNWADAVSYTASHGSELVAATFAIAIALMWLRLRAVSRSAQTLRGEMSRMQMQLLSIERLQFESEKSMGSLTIASVTSMRVNAAPKRGWVSRTRSSQSH